MALHELMQTARDWIASGAWADAAWRLAGAAAVLVLTFVLARATRMAVRRFRKGLTDEAPMMYIVERLGVYAIVVCGIATGAGVLGLDLSSFALFGGALGVGVGLGLQGIVKEFVSGIVLIFDTTIEVGDFVEMDDGIRGEVVEIGARAVRLRTNDDLNILIPNSNFVQSRLTNWTYNQASRRIHVPFAVAEQSDIARVREVALKAARDLPFTLPDDKAHRTQVWLTAFAGSGLEFDLVVWPTLESSRHPRTLHAAYTWAIYQALRAAGVDNSQDQLDVRVAGVFGLEGDEALRALRREARQKTERGAEDHKAPNDAAASVHDEIHLQRNRDAPRRGRPAPQ